MPFLKQQLTNDGQLNYLSTKQLIYRAFFTSLLDPAGKDLTKLQ